MSSPSLFLINLSEKFSCVSLELFSGGRLFLELTPNNYTLHDELLYPALQFHQQTWLRVPSTDLELRFRFDVVSEVKGLTFIQTSSGDQLHELLYVKFTQDPNIHRLPNVTLIGDLGCCPNEEVSVDQSAPVDSVTMPPFIVREDDKAYYEWTWTYRPLDEDGTNVCSFFEYSAKENGFRVLSTFSFYAGNLEESVTIIPAELDPILSNAGEKILRLSVQRHSRENSTGQVSEQRPFSMNLEEFDYDDGPLFRATIQQMEKRTTTLKQGLKKLIRTFQSAIDADKKLCEAEAAVVEAVQAFPSLQVAADYLKEANGRMTRFRENYHHQMESLLLEPLRSLYENDVKNAESRKKGFDQESDEFYSFLSKYLSMKNFDKKAQAYEQKYNTKKKSFDLGRFDYLSYMQDLHGRKEQEVMYHISGYAERQANLYHQCSATLVECKPQLELLCKHVEENTRTISHALKEREEKRKTMEKNNEVTNSPFTPRTSDPMSPGMAHMIDPPKFKGIRDMEHHDLEEVASQGRRKEGFLYAFKSGTPGAANHWKKLWCVLAGGLFQEYLHWKDGMKINSTFDLRFCACREARNVDRRFCFEIISPQFKRTYQALSQEDMTNWIVVIGNAIESLLNGTCSQDNLTLDSSSYIPSTRSFSTFNIMNELQLVDPENNFCADCHSKNADWCSINLGVVLCIECSGVHRSLGTHISKIRSLTLDTLSYTPEVVEHIKSLGNTKVNATLEACITPPFSKPQASDRRDVKQKFIVAKYVDLAFVSK